MNKKLRDSTSFTLFAYPVSLLEIDKKISVPGHTGHVSLPFLPSYRLLLSILLCLLIVLPSVASLEITPTRKIFDNKEATLNGEFKIVNSEHKAYKLVVSARGELAEHVKFKDFVVDMKPTDAERVFTYTITLPATFDKPGNHEAEIFVLAQPMDAVGKDDTSLGVSVTLTTKVRVRIPYPGKYAEATLQVDGQNVNDTIVFVMPVSNLGSSEITSAKGVIQILGPTNSVIDTVSTGEGQIPAGTTQELLASWLAQVNPGTYQASATLNYDGKTTSATKSFSVGNIFVDIIGADVKGFKLGGIAKIALLIRSSWNQDIPDTYAELFIYDDAGELNTVYDSKSTYTRIGALATDTLPLYWDTQGLTSGTYTAKVILHYAGRTTERTFTFTVGTDKMDARLISATGKAISEKPGADFGSLPMLTFVFFAIVILIAINVALFFYLRKTLSAIKK